MEVCEYLHTNHTRTSCDIDLPKYGALESVTGLSVDFFDSYASLNHGKLYKRLHSDATTSVKVGLVATAGI